MVVKDVFSFGRDNIKKFYEHIKKILEGKCLPLCIGLATSALDHHISVYCSWYRISSISGNEEGKRKLHKFLGDRAKVMKVGLTCKDMNSLTRTSKVK